MMIARRPLVTRRDALLAATVAVAGTGLLFAGLAHLRGRWPDSPQRAIVVLSLDASIEQPNPRYPVGAIALPAVEQQKQISLPPMATPLPSNDSAPEPPPEAESQPSGLDATTLRELEREREDLKARLAQARADAESAAERAVLKAMAGRARSLDIAAGPKGTVRQLDLSGHPQAIIDEVMRRHRLRVSRQVLTGPAEQNFLSSADARGDRFFANSYSTPGIYEVFELSPEAVAHMSRLEEAEIRRRNLNLERTKVTRVVFGIVQTPEGDHDIGLLDFEVQSLD
ncbi:MAG: hypothetical protein N2111_11420 [Candidatus Sumerlaeaceae bacterium]|nr:hypothetical protein [Candidatus Sumerlaeaceae bacterium]